MIDKNRRSKVFTKKLGRSHLTRLKTSNGKTATSFSEILVEIEDFYIKLYASHAPMPPNDPKALFAAN